MKRPAFIILFVWLTAAPLSFWADAQAGQLGSCGYMNLPIMMQQLPTTSEYYMQNLSAINVWNKYMGIIQTYPSDGTWGKNSSNEFGGFPPDAQLYDLWGFHWGTAYAKTLQTFNGDVQCGRIFQSDVVFKPGLKWTLDALAAEDDSSLVFYDSVLLHELGHVWGMQRRKYIEDYKYTQPSVMHAYYNDIVQDEYAVHYPEAWCIRRVYQEKIPIKPFNNMVVISKYADAQGDWSNASTDYASYTAGESMTISNMTVENTGTSTLPNVHLRFYLSADRFYGGDTLIHDFKWDTFQSETYQVLNFNMKIPASVPTGDYYVVARVTIEGNQDDDWPNDSMTHLFRKIHVTRRTVTVTYPNGGEQWVIGSTKPIAWSSSNLTGTVSIEVIRKGVATLIEANAPNTGSYNWLVDAPEANRCTIKVTSNSYPVVNDTSDGLFTIGSRYIKVLSPNGGEVWYLGYGMPIKWESYGLESDVKIEISRNNGATWSFLTNAVNSGSFDWLVQGDPKRYCRFRISSLNDPSVNDASDGSFQISMGKYTVVEPNGGENWVVGSTRNILWTREHDLAIYAKIELSRDGGGTWETLSAGALNGSPFGWKVTAPASTQCRIRVTSGKTPLIQDTSDEDFNITMPIRRAITVTAPNGGETWIIGSNKAITWTSRSAGSTVKIEVLRDRMAPQIIAAAAPNTGSLLWVVSGQASAACRVRITSVQYPTVKDLGDANFTMVTR
jgi:hypothetical protein